MYVRGRRARRGARVAAVHARLAGVTTTVLVRERAPSPQGWVISVVAAEQPPLARVAAAIKREAKMTPGRGRPASRAGAF